MCNDPNQYWLGDATCSCAYQNGRYSDAVSDTCGTGTVFVNSRTGQEDVTVTNYGMTLFLELHFFPQSKALPRFLPLRKRP